MVSTLLTPTIEREMVLLVEGDETQDEFERMLDRYSTGTLQMEYYRMRWRGMGTMESLACRLIEKLLTKRQAFSA